MWPTKEVENKLQQNNIREVWKEMRNITGYSKKSCQLSDSDVDRANNFSLFINRFDGGGSVNPTPASINPLMCQLRLMLLLHCLLEVAPPPLLQLQLQHQPPMANYHCPLQQTR